MLQYLNKGRAVSLILLLHRRSEKFERRQEGFVLLELLTALPMVTLLLAASAGVFLYGMKIYWQNLADSELQQEIQIAASQIIDDLAQAKQVEALPGSEQEGVMITQRYAPLSGKSKQANTIVTYQVYQSGHTTKKLARGSDRGAPLTGNHALAGVTVEKFTCQPDADKPGLVHLYLLGRSEVTSHTYAIRTTIFMPPAT